MGLQAESFAERYVCMYVRTYVCMYIHTYILYCVLTWESPLSQAQLQYVRNSQQTTKT